MGFELDTEAFSEPSSLALCCSMSLCAAFYRLGDVFSEWTEVSCLDAGSGRYAFEVASSFGGGRFVVVGERAERFLGSDLVNVLAIRAFRLWGSSFQDDGAMRLAVGTFEDSSASGASILGFIGGVVGFHPSNLSGGSLGLSRRSR
jgi:hypothetical protein